MSGSCDSSHPIGNSSPTQSANVWGFVILQVRNKTKNDKFMNPSKFPDYLKIFGVKMNYLVGLNRNMLNIQIRKQK